MHTRTIFFLVVLMMSCHMEAALKYRQDLTMMSWKSQEDVEERVQEFCNATIGEPNIKVIGVKFQQKKNRKDISYIGIITCLVSEVDNDCMRISGKIFH